MSSEFARRKAAQAWCQKETSDIEMDVRLSEAFAGIIDEYIGALQWCSAASDFQKGGQARKGWRKIEYRLLTDEHTPIEGEDGYNEYIKDATERAEKINEEILKSAEGQYPPNWKHATIHLNPETGEMHSCGDHSVRIWIQERFKKIREEAFTEGCLRAGKLTPDS